MTAAVTLASMGNGPAFSAAKTNGTQTVTANTYTKATFNFEEGHVYTVAGDVPTLLLLKFLKVFVAILLS